MIGKKAGWLGNLVPAIVVVLISIPLSMGIAIASGVPPVLGLVTAIVGGMIIGALAGSPIQISGPSAGLAVMVLEVVHGRGLTGIGRDCCNHGSGANRIGIVKTWSNVSRGLSGGH